MRETIFKLILKFKQEHDGCGPTILELQDMITTETGKKPVQSTIYFHLNSLATRGQIILPKDQLIHSRRSGRIMVNGGTWTYENPT